MKHYNQFSIAALAVFDIVILWAAIAATIISFWRKSRPAGILLIPYLVWVSLQSI